MKAVRIHAFGGPEVVTYEDIPQPVPKAHEVLLQRIFPPKPKR
jgi:NADPH:quinone reductase-like Zn-dependent oxidoreductase